MWLSLRLLVWGPTPLVVEAEYILPDERVRAFLQAREQQESASWLKAPYALLSSDVRMNPSPAPRCLSSLLGTSDPSPNPAKSHFHPTKNVLLNLHLSSRTYAERRLSTESLAGCSCLPEYDTPIDLTCFLRYKIENKVPEGPLEGYSSVGPLHNTPDTTSLPIPLKKRQIIKEKLGSARRRKRRTSFLMQVFIHLMGLRGLSREVGV